jgi:hypothetical protein
VAAEEEEASTSMMARSNSEMQVTRSACERRGGLAADLVFGDYRHLTGSGAGYATLARMELAVGASVEALDALSHTVALRFQPTTSTSCAGAMALRLRRWPRIPAALVSQAAVNSASRIALLNRAWPLPLGTDGCARLAST